MISLVNHDFQASAALKSWSNLPRQIASALNLLSAPMPRFQNWNLVRKKELPQVMDGLCHGKSIYKWKIWGYPHKLETFIYWMGIFHWIWATKWKGKCVGYSVTLDLFGIYVAMSVRTCLERKTTRSDNYTIETIKNKCQQTAGWLQHSLSFTVAMVVSILSNGHPWLGKLHTSIMVVSIGWFSFLLRKEVSKVDQRTFPSRHHGCFNRWAIKNTSLSPSHLSSWLIGFSTMGYQTPQINELV